MTFHTISRRPIVVAAGALALAASSVPGSAAGNVLDLQDSDPANLKPGQIATIAGTGEPVSDDDDNGGDGQPAVEAQLGPDLNLDVAPDGTIYVVDQLTDRLRVIDPGGTLDTVSDAYMTREPDGDDWPPSAVAVDADGRAYVSNQYAIRRAGANGRLETIARDADTTLPDGANGGPDTKVGDLYATSIDVATDGSAYVANNVTSNRQVLKIAQDGTVSSIAGGGNVAIDASDGKAATKAELHLIQDVAVDSQGIVYFTELITDGPDENRGSYIRRVDVDGTISTVVGGGESGFSGDGGPADEAQIGASISGVAMDANDNLLFIDQDNHVVRRVDPDGVITTIAPVWYLARDLAVGPEGNLYFAAMGQVFVMGMNADGLPVDQGNDAPVEDSPGDDPWADEDPGTILTVTDEGLDMTDDLTVGADGSIYAVNVADENQLVTVTPTGDVTAIAGGADEGYPFDRGMTGVETGQDGSTYLAAGGAVARIYPDGTTSVVAGGDGVLHAVYDGQLASTAAMGSGIRLASAPDGRLYIADAFSGAVYELNDDGTLGVVAEGVYSFPGGIAADADHNVYVTDQTGQEVLKIDSTGSVSAFAGLGDQPSSGDFGDGERADEAPVIGPKDVAVHPDGTVYISTGHGIRTVDAEGIIDTVAEFDNNDDSRAAPNMLAFDPHGNLYFSDRPGGQVGVLVRPSEMSDRFPWWIVWVSAAAVVVLAGAGVVLVRRRREAAVTPV